MEPETTPNITKVTASNMPSLASTPKPLSPEAAIIKLMSLAPDYPKFGIKSLAIFGSVSHRKPQVAHEA